MTKLRIEYEHPVAVNAFKWVPKPYKQALHYHASLEVGYCVSGTGTFYFGEKRYPVRAGDIFIVNNQEPHIAVSDVEDPSTFLFINFDPAIILQEDAALLYPFAYQSADFANRIPGNDAQSAAVSQLIVTVYEELQAKRPGYCSLVKSHIVQLCVLLLRSCSANMSAPEWKRRAGAFYSLRSMLGFMEKHFREPIGLNDLADFLGLTPATASRYFKELAGRHFADYLQVLRIREAKQLLISTDMAMTEICFASGFQSLSSFYRLFQQRDRCTPQAYRENYSAAAIIESAVQRSGGGGENPPL